MKKKFKIVFLLICVGLVGCLTGCVNNLSIDDSASSNPKKDYDLFIYNSDTDIGTSFRKMCDEYTSRTGVIIRTVTPSEDENNMGNLENFLTSEYPPDIFTVGNIGELKKHKSNSQVWDFSNATEESFKKAVNGIPEILRLSSNTTDSFGVPYTVEGYGLLVDPKMISSLFGGDKYRKVLNDLKECSYNEFVDFVEALKVYINDGGVYDFTLNNRKYSFVSSKGELSKNLNGIFSFAAGNTKYAGTYLTNIALASIFKTPSAANISSESDIQNLRTPLIRFAETVDMITSNMSGIGGTLGRGLELVSNTQNSISQSTKNFVNGKSVFLIASTEDYKNVSIFNSLIAKRCVFVPIKLSLTQEDIKSGEYISQNIHRSIPIYAPRYYCINAKSSAKEQKTAQDFLTWIMTSDLAKKYVISEFGFTPYDIEESSVIDNSFSRSMIEYMSENRILPSVFQGAPESWCGEGMGKYLIEQFFNKAYWDFYDYEKIADYGVKKWEELKEK